MTLTLPVRLPYAGPPVVPGYVLGDFLGRGSSGLVWSGVREITGEPVAVKVIPAREDNDRDLHATAARELAIGKRVEAAHVVRARELVQLEDDGVALVLDLADGGSLRDLVTVRGVLPVGEVVTTLTPLATTLEQLHQAGVVHADIAPGNVLFTKDGRPMLADLASARLMDEGWPDTVHATTGFVAPEVVAGHPSTPASDIWSLGALAWYARTGGTCPPEWVGDLHWRRPVPADGPDDHGTRDDATAAVGLELLPLLLRMLADDPQVRPTAAEAALALYRVAPAQPVALVGHHPDPAAAVTNRIRQEAAETRSRSQLRAVRKEEQRRQVRERRRARLRHPFRRRPARAAAGIGFGLAVALALLAVLGPSSFSTPVPATPVAESTVLLPAAPAGTEPLGAAAPTMHADVADLAADPRAVLQHIADSRAAALRARDPVALTAIEPEGSPAYAADASTLTRLREQGQRYAELAFVVRSAEVLRKEATTVVLRAQVDRAACTVVGQDGATATLPQQEGPVLRYTLRRGDWAWELTDVSPD